MLTRHLLKLIELKLSGLVVLSVIVLRGLEPKYVAVGANLVLKVLRKGTDVSDCVLLVSCGRQDTLLLNALAAWAMLVVHELGHRHELTRGVMRDFATGSACCRMRERACAFVQMT